MLIILDFDRMMRVAKGRRETPFALASRSRSSEVVGSLTTIPTWSIDEPENNFAPRQISDEPRSIETQGREKSTRSPAETLNSMLGDRGPCTVEEMGDRQSKDRGGPVFGKNREIATNPDSAA